MQSFHIFDVYRYFIASPSVRLCLAFALDYIQGLYSRQECLEVVLCLSQSVLPGRK